MRAYSCQEAPSSEIPVFPSARKGGSGKRSLPLPAIGLVVKIQQERPPIRGRWAASQAKGRSNTNQPSPSFLSLSQVVIAFFRLGGARSTATPWRPLRKRLSDRFRTAETCWRLACFVLVRSLAEQASEEEWVVCSVATGLLALFLFLFLAPTCWEGGKDMAREIEGPVAAQRYPGWLTLALPAGSGLH